MRARVALFDHAQVGDDDGVLREVALRVDVLEVEVCLIGTRDGVVHVHDRRIDEHMRAPLDADWAHEARAAAGSADGLFVGHAQVKCALDLVDDLDLVDVVVTADEGEHELVLVRLVGDGLDRLVGRHLEEVAEGFDGVRARRADLLERQLIFSRSFDWL